jgi:hypothetical protein
MVKILDKKITNLVFKNIGDLKEHSNKQMNEIKKSIQELDERVTWMRNPSRK